MFQNYLESTNKVIHDWGTMDGYKLQLEQVRITLESDPHNGELLKMASNLEKLIALSDATRKPEQKSASSSSKNDRKEVYDWKVGEKCEAKNAGNVYCPATIVSMSADRNKFTVSFATGDALIVSQAELRKCAPVSIGPVASNEKKKAIPADKKKNKRTKAEYIEEKEKEHAVKQASWQKFTSKAVKQGSVGIAKKSIFSSTSSKSMTDFAKKSKHTFNIEDEKE